MKESVRQGLRWLGLEVRKYQPHRDPYRRLVAVLQRQQLGTVLDVGANVGQFANKLRQAGYKNQIISFEPLSDAYTYLVQAAKSDPRWTIEPRCGVGARNGTTEIQIAGNSQSSSILDMTDRHRKGEPSSVYIGKETTDVITLADYLTAHADLRGIGLKIDTQGYEAEVLEGLGDCWDRAKVIQIELSLTTLYVREKLFLDLYGQIEDHGYRCISLEPGFTDRRTMEMLQVDAIFETIL